MHRHLKTIILLLAVVVIVSLTLFACQPVEQQPQDKYPIQDGEQNESYKDHTTKDQAIDRAVDSLENLLKHLDSSIVSDTGYYLGADMLINTEDGSAFRLRLEANLYTYPHEMLDADGNVIYEEEYNEAGELVMKKPKVDPEKLAIHNDLIRYSDIVLEWFDGASNEMLIGFYFDGINPNSVDDGNDLYLNLQGSKRIFKDFGDSVFYQQFIRLITQFNLETVIGSTADDGEAGTAMQGLRDALDLAVTTNYKQTINGDDTTIFFNDVALTAIADTVTDFMQSIFAPFEDKLDPLTNKYLGFLFSTLGVASFQSIESDMEFIMTPNEALGTEILRELVLDAHGNSSVPVYNEQTGLTTVQTIPYQAHIAAKYDVRVSANIVFDKSGYTLYDYGNYEYTGDMYIPMLDLELDVLLRTDINEVDNKINDVFMNCRDIATDDLIIGMYYENELTYLDIQGLQHLYGGIAFEDIGLPKAYKGGFDLAETLAWLFDFIDEYMVIAVDNILYGVKSESEDSQYAELTSTIMNNVTSTMKDEDDPSSRATIKIKVDVEMIRRILSITSETGVEYTTEQMILLINQQFNIDLESIAAILGISIEELIDTTYFDITYDVDEYSIRLEVFSFAEMSDEDIELYGPALIMRMDLYPQHIGEYVRIVFPNFDDFKPLQDVMTYSGYLEGQFIFAATEEVDLSGLLGSFMGDMSGLNTPFILPASADIYFTLYYDQYIREQVLDNGRWTRSTRSAFNLYFYMVENDVITPIIRAYANDVSFNTADPIEELGYIWLDYLCLEDMPKFKVREDIFIRSFYEYMGYDFENEDEDIVMGLTDIVQALMEDSWAVFEPDVIRLTTSNQTIKDLFRVDELIGTIAVQIGFKQRVFDIDQLEANFAMYSVGELEDIEGESVYAVKLHDTVKVYFDFGTRTETRDFYFLYDPNTITVVNGETYYMPSMDNLFMGVTRDYLVRITTDIGKQGINSLVNDYYVWEPLDPIPNKVAATYGNDNLRYNYDAEFRLHAVYDRATGYYSVLNDLGYEIIYDFENDLYVLGLGTQFKYDKAIEEVINTDVPYYYQNYENNAGLHLVYDLGLHKKGWYVVEGAESRILYNQDKDYYVVETEEIRKALLAKNYFGEPAEDAPPIKVYPRQFVSSKGFTFTFDLDSGMFCTQIPRGDGTFYVVLYDYDQEYFFARTYQESLTIQSIIGEVRVASSASVSFEYDFDFTGANYDKVDWNDTIFTTFSFTDMDWEDLTLEGGKFVVYVIIGDGMMATYRQNVVVKVLNRTIDTEKYVNIETPEGTVRAPVADYISIDPYVYLIYKAYYENSGNLSEQELLQGFIEWYFNKYEVTFTFTKIYNDPEEDTPDEVGFFNWAFDDNSRNSAIYKEFDINNRHSEGISKFTYVYTVFHGQVIALSVEVMPRTLDSIWVEGEENRGEYTVDALEPDTYVLPTSLIYYFKGQNGEDYVLNFKDYNYSEEGIPSLFSTLPATFEGFASSLSGVNFGALLDGPNALSIIKWAQPSATNVKLEGNTYPFKDLTTDVTTSFFDLANNFDLARNWYHRGDYDEGWFFIEEVSLKVKVPDKIIGERDYTFKTGADFHEVTETVMNVQVAPYYTEGQTTVGDNWGIFYVDPYDSSTWVLPKEVYVLFDGVIPGTYSPYFYEVAWRNVEGDSIVHYDSATGEYVLLIDENLTANYYFLEATIGSGENTMTIRVLVQHMTGVVEDITFRMENGELADGNLVNEGINYTDSLTASDVKESDYQLKTYNWAVDTYARFQVPEVLDVLFADGTRRSYPADWHDHDPWVQGTSVKIYTTLGDAYAKQKDMALTYNIEAKTIATIILNRLSDANMPDGAKVVYLVDDNAIELTDVTLNAQGLIAMKDGSGMTAYDFFNWLMGDITITFFEDVPAIHITDAATSAELPIFGTLDTQKLIEAWSNAYGQGVDIYVGQDLGAHDYTIKFTLSTEDKDKIDFDSTQSNVIDYVELEVYNADNTPKYPNGYVVKDNLTFTLKRADGSVTVYGGSGAPLPDVWSVAFPSQEIEDAYWSDSTVRMVEVTPYEQLTTISWERLMLGGEIWLSAMLQDSSRVYVRIASRSYDIGSNFHSADDDDSRYKITYGTVVIDNLYDNYRLSSFVTPDNLPSKVKIGDPNASPIVKSGIVWNLVATREQLDAINYEGTQNLPGGVLELAKAIIMGKEVTLNLKVLPTEVMRLNYDNAQVATSRHFLSEEKNDLGYIVVNVDAYHNWAYNGNFIIPSNIKFLYKADDRFVDVDGNGANDGYPNEFNYTGVYFYLEEGGEQISEIAYDLNGHKIGGLTKGNPSRDVYTYATLKDGQMLKVIFHFLDKTVESINAGQNDDSILTLDPYTEENISVPNVITINFAEGQPLEYQVAWEVPTDFEVKYDTFRRVLGGDVNNYFAFISTLTGYVGMEDQDLLLKVKVYDRVFDSYELVSGVTDYYVNYQEPNAYYQYVDVFSGKASDLPSEVESVYSGGINYPLVWNFTDAEINAEGALEAIYVTGNIYKADRGQPVVIKVYVDSYKYQATRRPTASGDYIIMEGDSMRFIINAITGVSSLDHYLVDFEVTSSNPLTKGETRIVSKKFIPQGIDPQNVDSSFDSTYAYRMLWDQDALNRAKSQGSATGFFILANELNATKFQLTPATYQYENPNILQIDLGYGMGTENNAIFVVNPLNPIFENMKVSAIGTYNTEYAISYDDQGLVTRVIWNAVTTPKISDTLLAGGVVRNWQVVLELTNPKDENFIYTQTFEIVLVALDMSPTSYINNSSASTLTNASYKTKYNASTYAGASNPYKDLYLDYLVGQTVTRDGVTDNILNTAIRDYRLEEGRLTYVVSEWDSNIYTSNNTKTQYSKKVVINDREYTTNMVKRVWNQKFSITGLNLGYGMGMDSLMADAVGTGAQRIVTVLNPVQPYFGEQYASDPYVTKLLPENVQGTYDGNDISTLGYTFSLTWWDRENNGDTVVFGSEYFGGGMLNYWKVKVSVYNGAEVVYEQIVNVMILLLDMTPIGQTTFYSESENTLSNAQVKTTYTANTYDGVENPYGPYYSTMIASLNNGATEQITTNDYTYRVVSWGAYEALEDGTKVRRSEVVEIIVNGSVVYTVSTDLFETRINA